MSLFARARVCEKKTNENEIYSQSSKLFCSQLTTHDDIINKTKKINSNKHKKNRGKIFDIIIKVDKKKIWLNLTFKFHFSFHFIQIFLLWLWLFCMTFLTIEKEKQKNTTTTTKLTILTIDYRVCVFDTHTKIIDYRHHHHLKTEKEEKNFFLLFKRKKNSVPSNWMFIINDDLLWSMFDFFRCVCMNEMIEMK